MTLEFNEPVSAPRRRPSGPSTPTASGSTTATRRRRAHRLRLGLTPGLGDGAYIVTYRVISADAHPVTGAFSFTVGDGRGRRPATVAGLLGEDDDRPWEIAGAVARGVRLRRRAARRRPRRLPRARPRRRRRGRRGSPRPAPRRRGVGAVGVARRRCRSRPRWRPGLGIGAIIETGVAGQVLGDGVGVSLVAVLAGLGLLVLVPSARRRGRRRPAARPVARPPPPGRRWRSPSPATPPPTDPRVAGDGQPTPCTPAPAPCGSAASSALAVVLRARRADRGRRRRRRSSPGSPAIGGRRPRRRRRRRRGVCRGGRCAPSTPSPPRPTAASSSPRSPSSPSSPPSAAGTGSGSCRPSASAPKTAAALLRRTVRVESPGPRRRHRPHRRARQRHPGPTAAGIGGIFSETVAVRRRLGQRRRRPTRVGPTSIHLYLFDEAGRRVDDRVRRAHPRALARGRRHRPARAQPFVAGPGHYQVDDQRPLDPRHLDDRGRRPASTASTRSTAAVEVPVNP